MLYAILLMQIFVGQSESSENTVEKLSLAEKLFPDAELIWSKTFEGKIIDFDIAEKSGHVILGAIKDRKGYVYFFSPDGKLLWTKENAEHSEIKKCAGIRVSVSDSAETIGIFWWGDYEYEEVQVYDISGEKLYAYDHGMSGSGVEISPGGGYVKHAWFFDKTGKQIILREILKGLPIEKLWDGKRYRDITISKFDFVSENELVILLDNVLYFYSFPEGELIWKSQKLALENGGGITIQGKYILINARNLLYCFNKNGELLWKQKWEIVRINAVSISSDEKYMAINAIVSKGRKFLLCDSKTGEIKLSTDKLESQIGVKNFLCLEGKVLVSGYTGSHIHDNHKGYWTYILHFDDNWNIINESYERGLVMGTYDSPIITVYVSDATDITKTGYQEGPLRYENSTVFTVDVLKIRD